MAGEYISDEDNYTNDSFENDTESENHQVTSALSSDSEGELNDERNFKNNNRYIYKRDHFNRRNRADRDRYASASQSSSPSDDDDENNSDDNDVVIEQGLADINTEPMCMENAELPPDETVHEMIRNPQSVLQTKAAKHIESVGVKSEHFQHQSESQIETESEPTDLEMEINDVNRSETIEIPIDIYMEATEPGDIIKPADIFDSNSMNKSYIETMNKNFETTQTFFPDEFARYEGEEHRSIPRPTTPDTSNSVHKATKSHDENVEAVLPDESNCQTTRSPNSNRSFKSTESARSSLTIRRESEVEVETLQIDQQIELCISNHTPSDFNADNYDFHMGFIRNGPNKNKKMRTTNRKSWSFSNERMREIERQNQILLKKILSQKGSYFPKNNSNGRMQNTMIESSSGFTNRQATSALNRKKQQRQIDLDNQILKRKIEAIAFRRPHLL